MRYDAPHGAPQLRANVDGEETPTGSSAGLAAILDSVASEALEFVILSEESCGWFVQAAGAHGSLTFEYQRLTESGEREHVRLCRSDLGALGQERTPPRVPGYRGYLAKELLSVEDGLAIFESFLASLDVPERFDKIDIGAELGLA